MGKFDKNRRSLVEDAREMKRAEDWDDLVRNFILAGLAAFVGFMVYMVLDALHVINQVQNIH